MYVSQSPQFLQFCQKSLQEIYVCVYFVLFRQKPILTYRVPQSVVQAKMLASPKFLNVCLQKSVVSVVLSKILARNIYVSILCSLGENSSKAKIFKCMSPKVRSFCSFVKNPCKECILVHFFVVSSKMLANTCKNLQTLATTYKHLQTLVNTYKHSYTVVKFYTLYNCLNCKNYLFKLAI